MGGIQKEKSEGATSPFERKKFGGGAVLIWSKDSAKLPRLVHNGPGKGVTPATTKIAQLCVN